MADRKTTLARRLRREANLPERAAWEALRKLRAHGFPLRRQHPVGPYVVDFAIARARLVIEIDGGVHRWRVDEDAARQAAIEALGWRFLRVTAQEAFDGDLLWRRVGELIGLE